MTNKLYTNESVYIVARSVEQANDIWNNCIYFTDNDIEFQKVNSSEELEVCVYIEDETGEPIVIPGGAELIGGDGYNYRLWKASAIKWAIANPIGYLGEIV